MAKIKFSSIMFILLLAAGLSIGIPAVPAKAEAKGSLTIDFHEVKDSGQDVPIEGAEFSIYRAGSMKDGGWVLSDQFAQSGISLSELSSSQNHEKAKLLYDYAGKAGLCGEIQVTGSAGKAVFRALDRGLYLAVQTGAKASEGGSYCSDPFLVAIPQITEEGEEYNVTVVPKNEWVEDGKKPVEKPDKKPDNNSGKTEKPKDNAKTGDNAAVLRILFIMACAFVIVVLTVAGKVIRNNQN